MRRERSFKEFALLPVLAIVERCAIGGRGIGCTPDPPQWIGPNCMPQMIFRKINRIHQLKRVLNAV